MNASTFILALSLAIALGLLIAAAWGVIELRGQLRVARHDLHATMDKLLTMRREGFAPAIAAKVHEAPDLDAVALQRAERQLIRRREDEVFVQRATADIRKKRPGISEADARREAMRLRAEVKMEDPPI